MIGFNPLLVPKIEEESMIPDALRDYLDHGFDQVHGWCERRAVEVVGELAAYAQARGVKGGACEIGVYEGKFFIALANMVGDQASCAIDIFDDYDQNVEDISGWWPKPVLGMKGQFRANLGLYCKNQRIAVEHRNSLRSWLPVLDESFSLFSIDGGHTATHVINDYKIAENATKHDGFIIIDDFPAISWLGVVEGVAQIFLFGRPKFVPLAVGHNKLIMTGITYHRTYLEFLRTLYPKSPATSGQLFGHELVVLS